MLANMLNLCYQGTASKEGPQKIRLTL